jgi:hypothetical protein
MAGNDLTAERMRAVTHYNPHTGAFTWRVPRRKCAVGADAGSTTPGSYARVKIDYKLYLAHRLAWLYMTGEWPAHHVDHINHDKSDNRWSNLRAATAKQNNENRSRYTRSTSGFIGVDRYKDKFWRARICHHRKSITLGYFKTFEEACECRRAAEARLYTHAQDD